MPTEKNLPLNEVSADIRNKLQTAITALELIKGGKKAPKNFIDKALKDLIKIEEICSERLDEVLSSKDLEDIRVVQKEIKTGKSISWKAIKGNQI